MWPDTCVCLIILGRVQAAREACGHQVALPLPRQEREPLPALEGMHGLSFIIPVSTSIPGLSLVGSLPARFQGSQNGGSVAVPSSQQTQPFVFSWKLTVL